MTKRFLFAMFVMIVSVMTFLASCSNDGENSNIEIYYGYKLNASESYHRVTVYYGIEVAENTYDMQTAEIHSFVISNDSYKDKTGSELCDIVRNKSVRSNSSAQRIESSATTATITGAKSGITKIFNIPAGMKYTVYYYQ